MADDPQHPDPPSDLKPEAQARWRQVIGALVGKGPVDLDTLATYCQVWARWRDAEAKLAQTGTLIKKGDRVGPNPLVAVSGQSGREVRALEQRLGIVREAAPRGPEPMSLRSYAKRKGVSPEAVSRAVAKGRLVDSVIYVDGAPKIADPDLADDEWQRNTDLSRAPGYVKDREGDEGEQEGEVEAVDTAESLSKASAREKSAKANLAEMQFRVRSGELVNAAEVQAEITDTFSLVRNKLLALPSKAKQAIPHLTHDELATIDEIVRTALDGLAVGAE